MKTNGSMIHRQWHINSAIRERRTPLASSPRSPSFSSVPRHPSHLFLLCPFFCLLAETQHFACEPCYSWLAGCSPVLGKESYKVLIWNKTPRWYTVRNICSLSLWMKSYRCVPTGSHDPSLCCQPLLCHNICSHPPVCPFLFVLFHSFSSHLSCGKDLQAEQDSVWNSGLS